MRGTQLPAGGHVTMAAGANGSITGTSPQTVNHGASGTAVTAVPDIGYHFVNWSDASTSNPRTDTNVTANISVSRRTLRSIPTRSPTAIAVVAARRPIRTAGQTYIVTVDSKRLTFTNPSRVISLADSVEDIDFVSSPE